MTEYTYRNIPGFFDFQDIYTRAVAEAPADRPSLFVEIGVFLGRSLFYLSEAVRTSGKPIQICAVDPFTSGWTRGALRELFDRAIVLMANHGDNSCQLPIFFPTWYKEGESNDVVEGGVLSGVQEFAKIKGLEDLIVFKPCMGQKALLTIDKIDFVFIDADHSYEDTFSLLSLCLPKMQPGGIIAGHDFTPDYPGVTKAVEGVFGHDYEVFGSSFFHRM